ncbi:unnamed protein product [Schistosoma turkestanicum]|nr:unnamed protein product [Schistosoma turkestanicum]
MNKFLPTSQIDLLLMDKPTVDPILLGLDEHNDNDIQDFKEFFSDPCLDLHREDNRATDSCNNQCEVDGVSCVDSECHQSWEAKVCSSEANVTSGLLNYPSSVVVDGPMHSQSTLGEVYAESNVCDNMKCGEAASHQPCHEVAKDADKHNTPPEYSKSSTSPFVKRQLATQEVPEHPCTSTAIHCRFTDTVPVNSFGLFQSSNKAHDISNRSNYSYIKTGQFTPHTERSIMFATSTVIPSTDPFNHHDASELDSQPLKETENISPNSSPNCRRPGSVKGSGLTSPSAAHLCSLCGKQYRHVASLRNHVRKHTTGALTSKRYKCNHCVYSSQYHRNVIKHMEATHRDHETFSTNNISLFTEVGATQCNSLASEELKSDFIDSRVWISGTKVEPNAYCTISSTSDSKDFSNVEQSTSFSTSNLEPHVIVSRQSSSNYDSRVANKHYESDHVGNLGPSMSCDQTFQPVKYLSNHVKDSHRDLKRFKCPLEGCSFCGQRRMHLKRHISEFHGDKKLSLYRMLDQNRFNHEPYDSSVQPAMMYDRQENLPLNVTKLPDYQSLKRQCYNPQMNTHVPLDTSYTSDYYRDPSCSGHDVYSFPMSGLSHPSGDCCFSENTAGSGGVLHNHQATKSFEQKPHSFVNNTSSQINRLFESTSSSSSSSNNNNMPFFQNEQCLSMNKTHSMNPSDDFHVQSPYPPSMSNQSIHYHQRNQDTLNNNPHLSCEVMTSESLHHEQQNFFPQNSVYSNVKSCLSFNPADPSTNRTTESDVVEQLLDSTNASNTVLDQILCESLEPNKDDEVKVETSTFSTATVNTSQMSPLNSKVISNHVKSYISDTNVSTNAVHTSTMLSETDAFLSDLQEILERDMPMLTSSTPKGIDSSEVVLVTVKETVIESKSPAGIIGCKVTSASSLPSTDSGHECWSSSSSCSAGPNNASAWGQQEAVTPLKVSSPFSSSYPSNQPSGTSHSTPSIFDNQFTEQVINEQFSGQDPYDQVSGKCSSTLHCASITVDGIPVTPQLSSVTGSYQVLPSKSNKNARLGNTSQLFHSHPSYPQRTNYVQNSQSPIHNSEISHLQYSQDYCASNQISSMYTSSDNDNQSVNQQNSIPFYSNHNSHLSSNDFTPNHVMFNNCQQNEAQQMCQQYSFNPSSSSSSSSLHSEPTYHSSYIQPKYQNYKSNEMDTRLTSFRNCPPQFQEQIYWQPNMKYRTSSYEQVPNNPPICRNMVSNNIRASYPFDNPMPYSQNNSTSTRIVDSTIGDNELNKSTHILRHSSDQPPIRNSVCPTPKYSNFPDIDNLNCDRTFQTTQQAVNKRWPTHDQQRLLFNPYSSYPSLSYTPSPQMTSPMYHSVGQSSIIHSISRVKSENSNPNRIPNHTSYFSNRPPSSDSQYYSNSVCYPQSRPSQFCSPHSQYYTPPQPPSSQSQSVYRDMSQNENYIVSSSSSSSSSSSDGRYFNSHFNVRHSNMELVGNWSVDKNSSYNTPTNTNTSIIGNHQQQQQGNIIISQGINNTNLIGYSIESNNNPLNNNNDQQHCDNHQQFVHNSKNSRYILSNSIDHMNSLVMDKQ